MAKSKSKNKEVQCVQEDIQDVINGLDPSTRMRWFAYKPHASSSKHQENFSPLPSPEKPVRRTSTRRTEDSDVKTEPIDLSLDSDDNFQIVSPPRPKKRSATPWSGDAIDDDDDDHNLSPPRKKKRSSTTSNSGNDDEDDPPEEQRKAFST
ncbi:hypothetical protein B0H14DRAFT_3441024 [Mycena olivaceomarginata]|nr:hypothetical protein B0H14DRAFT_3441024 [Mycena olivaceomarginata]